MSNQQQSYTYETFGLDGALEAVHKRRELGGVHDHHAGEGSNDHLASIYESREDQFEAVVPFLKQGLERGERCLYVADDNPTDAVLSALREGGIDVEAARESGALSIHTKADTYLRTDEFDPEAMLDFWQETLAGARDEDGYAGVRAAAEMTWALDEEPNLERLVQYEAMLNTIYSGDDYVVLCQYNRERFPTDILSDVIRSHPLVVHDGTVCQNFHYHSPDEFFGADHPSLDVDRTVEGLVSRARTRHALQESDHQLRTRLRQQEAVADLSQHGLQAREPDGLIAEATRQIADTLDADYCMILERLPDEDELLLREGVGWQDDVVGAVTVGIDCDSQGSYTLRSEGPVIVDDLATDPRFDAPDLLVDHDVTSGISVVIGPPNDPWGVLGVYTREHRDFSRHDAAFVQSIAITVATAIERVERERYQRELYDITSSPDRSLEGKLQALFDLGCERFGLDLGGIARLDPGADVFEVEYVSGDHEHLVPGARVDLSERHCRVHAEGGETTGAIASVNGGFDGTIAHAEFGANAYLGARIALADDLDRALFFVSSEPRTAEFSAAERTFCDLIGQWLRHELERQQYERQLEESNDRLEQFAYAASHDLQEPLRMVSSYLQFLENRYTDQLDADAEEFIGFAVDGADRMRAMIDGLLQYSRVDTQGDPLRPVDLETVVTDVLTDLQFQIDESDATITTGSLPSVNGDSNQLRQLFQNLLENALEYSGDEPPRVRIAAQRKRSAWLVSVSDEGIGIDPDNQDRIFELFKRLHAQNEHAGTGIGLALCQRIVERHGGDISVESAPGEGATFSVMLPAASDHDT